MRKAEGHKIVDRCRQHSFAHTAFRWGCDGEGVVGRAKRRSLNSLKSKDCNMSRSNFFVCHAIMVAMSTREIPAILTVTDSVGVVELNRVLGIRESVKWWIHGHY